MKKFIGRLVVLLMIFSSIMPTAFATDANSNEIFLKQNTSSTCTLSSAAMMLRRHAFMEGRSDWDAITESSIKSAAWAPGLYNSFSYSGYNVSSGKFSGSSSDRKNKIISMLNEHPEGIVIYLYDVSGSSKQHAVLATDYDNTDDILYVADPASGRAKGRISIMEADLVGSSQDVRIGNMKKYWYIKSGTNEISINTPSPVHEHKSVYKYETEHPHSYYIYCEECGYREYTGSYETLDNCTICNPHEHSWTEKYNSEHPHSVYRKCSSCGDIEYLGRNEIISSCPQCYPLESVVPIGENADSDYSYNNVKIIGEDTLFNNVKIIGGETSYNEIKIIGEDTLFNEVKIIGEDTSDDYSGYDEKIEEPVYNDNRYSFYNNNSKYEKNTEYNGIRVFVDDKLVEFDVEPMIINDRTMVPMRAIFEALGAEVSWNNTTRTVTGELDGTTVEITIGENHMYRDGKRVSLDSSATIINDRTLVPVRAIAESFDCEVNWYGETKSVEILSY